MKTVRHQIGKRKIKKISDSKGGMNVPDAHLIILALLGGLFSTLIMTFIEIPSWRKWGIMGVLEWHENQVIITRIAKLRPDRNHFRGIFALHFLNGGLGGIGFLISLWIFPFAVSQIFITGLIYGVFLWMVTLVPIHKPITGVSPWSHPLGHLPALASLIGHLVYGIVLSYFFSNTPF